MVDLIKLSPKSMEPEAIIHKLEIIYIELKKIQSDLRSSDDDLIHLNELLHVSTQSVYDLLQNLSVTNDDV